ncbi:MAG: hypothetical protein V1906_02845 [Candidatus Woesearchaeota archaeon]
MSWLQRHSEGIKAVVVVIGITTGIGAWTYCNMDRIGRNSIKAEQSRNLDRRKPLTTKQTIGVIIDSSLEDKVMNDMAFALNDVAESYKKYANIDYTFEFKFVEMPGNSVDESDLYHLVPSSFKNLDHRLFITNSHVLIEDEDSDDLLGFYTYNKATAVVHMAYKHQRNALYNIIAHELAHGQHMYHHVSDKNCIMHAKMTSETKKEFCEEMIRYITKAK